MMTDGTLPTYRLSDRRGQRTIVRVSHKDLREGRGAHKAAPRNPERPSLAKEMVVPMNSALLHQVVGIIESQIRSRPSGMEFEMAYQTHIAIERIRFAIKQTEHAGGRADQIRDAGMHLLEALDRLESIERRFQQRSRSIAPG
jgi:hypothetical protein